MMENVIHSDHTFNFVETSIEVKQEATKVPSSHYNTKMNNYEIKDATDMEWDSYNMDIFSVDWDNTVNRHRF